MAEGDVACSGAAGGEAWGAWEEEGAWEAWEEWEVWGWEVWAWEEDGEGWALGVEPSVAPGPSLEELEEPGRGRPSRP